MGRIPDDTLREVRERTSLVELIGETVPLRKAGQSWKGLCPFHTEKTPSFTVSEARGFYHCFGCGASGTAFDFLMRRDGLTFPEAARALARRAGVPVPEADVSPEARRTEAERDALFALNAAAAAFFAARLAGPEGRAAREHLAARGIAPETAEAFGLGYAPVGWDNLLRHLAGRGHGEEVVARAGLAVARERGNGYYDRFRDRLMIPIADGQGRVIAFGGRAMAKDEPAKYLNSAESPLYRKSEVLFGLHQAREPIRRAEQAIVVEGYFDCIALHQAGVRETVATCGTALTPQHVQVLKRYARQVVTVFDGDEAGARAAARSLPLFLEAEVAARVARLDPGDDPDTFVRRAGAEALRARVKAAPDLVEALIAEQAAREDVRTVDGKARVVRALAPVLARVPDRFARDRYIQVLVDEIGGPGEGEALVRRYLRGVAGPRAGAGASRNQAGAATSSPAGVQGTGTEQVGDCLVRAVLLSPAFAGEVLSSGALADLADPAVSALVGAAAGLLREAGPDAVTPARLAEVVSDDAARRRLSRVAVGLDELPLDETAARRQGADALRAIRARAIGAALTEVQRALRDARRRGAADEVMALVERANALASEKRQVSPPPGGAGR